MIPAGADLQTDMDPALLTGKTTVAFYTAGGRKINEKPLNSSRIPTPVVAPGTYIVAITVNQKLIKTTKVVIGN